MKEEREPFLVWKTLKVRVLEQFQSMKRGTVCGQFLAIKQETIVKEYINLFDKLVAPLPHLSNEVLENTFMNGLVPWVKAEVECWEPVGLMNMMKVAQRVKNRELVWKETSLDFSLINKAHSAANNNKSVVNPSLKETIKTNEVIPMRTITLRRATTNAVRREGLVKRLSDAEFQARKEKGLCFRCDDDTRWGINVR